ncbi:MAG: nucleotidyl transferase AbiEii/AbiGii toxin family protein [Steroidobacteraceae bacterium]
MPPELLRKFQARFLRELFRRPHSGFILKGGLALNALYGSSRLTMDIDLDFPPQSKRTSESLHTQINQAITASLIGLGVTEIRVSKPGKGEVSPKWKVSGTSSDGAPFHVKVEVSRRPPIPAGTTRQHALHAQLAPGLPVFYVDIYDEPTLAAMKLAALLSTSRHAPRDVYDLDLLIANGHRPDPSILGTMLELRGHEVGDLEYTLHDKLESLSWPDFQSQLQSALEPGEAERFDAREWETMKQRVGDHALRWIRELPERLA